MNKDVLKFVDQIIAKVTKSGISALEVEVDGVKVRAERGNVDIITQSAPSVASNLQMSNQPEMVAKKNNTPPPDDADEDNHEDGKVVKSPIVGTFYLTPGPNDEPFVKIGKQVKKGDVVCIVEAMKIMNEIECEFDGIVKAILVDKGELVEYGQPLIVIG